MKSPQYDPARQKWLVYLDDEINGCIVTIRYKMFNDHYEAMDFCHRFNIGESK